MDRDPFSEHCVSALGMIGGAWDLMTLGARSTFSAVVTGARGLLGGGRVAKSGAALLEAKFAQRTFGEAFSAGGKFAGQTIDDVADALKSGSLKADDVPVDYIVRNGNTLILNTRSAQALERAGVPRSRWNGVNRTGQAEYEARLTGQLRRNRLTEEGIQTPRSSAP